MKSLRRVLPTGWRLIVGAAQSLRDPVDWRSAPAAIERADVVSFDVFDTLLLKEPDLDRQIRRSVSEEIVKQLRDRRAARFPDEATIRGELDRIQRGLAREASKRGEDPEIPRRRLYETLFDHVFEERYPRERIDRLLQFEIERHFSGTRVDAEVLEFLEHCRAEGKRVIAITDTHLGAEGIRALLRMHGVDRFDAVYASSDSARSKFHGGLFSDVLAAENVRADRLLHIGDSRLADVYSARSRGVRGVHRDPAERGSNSDGFRLGYESLGPMFATFSHLLLRASARDGISRLAFVARDGEFLREVTERLVAAAPLLPRPSLDYIYLSRRATALPALRRLDEAALVQVQSVRAGGSVWERFLEYYDLDRVRVDAIAGNGEPSILRLLESPAFHEFVEEQRTCQTALLADYLRDAGIFSGGDVALVDVGWKASTQRAVNDAFAGSPPFVPPRFYYLGIWSELDSVPSPGGSATGILADQRRGGSILEGAAWQMAFLIESVCRARHSTVTGFTREAGGSVRPRFAPETPARRAEIRAERNQEPIRQGILAFVDDYGNRLGTAPVNDASLRRRAQLRMIRLAFFPRRWERNAASGLVHTEGNSQAWSTPLIAPARPHPLLAPRRWLAGLTSPWRGAYVAATGGYPFSIAFLGLETLLTALPSGVRRALREWALERSDSKTDVESTRER